MHTHPTAAVIALLLAGALAGCDSPPVDEKPRADASTPGCHVTDRPNPGRDDEVAVLDLGSTVDRDSQGRPRISYGAVLVNNSADLVAGRLDLRVRMREASGTLLTFRDDLTTEPVTESIHGGWLRPGERMGIGGYVYLVPASGRELSKATVDVEVADGSWFTSCAFVMRRVEVSDVAATRKGGTAVVRFTADLPSSCTFTELTSDLADLQVVYRDRDGAIVGGDAPAVERHETEEDVTGHPGRVTASAQIPASADPGRTEVYALGGCGGPPGPTAT